MSSEDHRQARYQGEALVASAISGMVKAGTPIDVLESFAAGVLAGVGSFLTAYVSCQQAYAQVQQAADDIASGRRTNPSEARS